MADDPQRVLMTADAIGGVWTYAMELSRGLTSSGVQVALAVMGGISPEREAEAAGIDGVTLYPGSYKLEWMPEPWDDVEQAGRWLLDVAHQFRPDIIHLNGFAHAALPWRAPVLVVAHSCVCSWWRAVKGEPAPAEWHAYWSAVNDGLRAADCIVAPSRAFADALRAEYGRLPEIDVIPNGRTPHFGGPAQKESVVLSAGRLWDEGKNIAVLSRAAENGRLAICVAGEASHMDGKLRFMGHLTQPQLASWYARAAVYAAPARYEPFGYAPLEAAQAGCALVLSDIPTFREIWGDAAQYVKPGDADAWRTTLQALIEEPQQARTWGEQARLRSVRYSADQMTKQYLDFYQKLGHGLSRCESYSSHTPFDLTGTTATRTSSAV